MRAVSLRGEATGLAYLLGRVAVLDPPQHLDFHRGDGRFHVHLIAESWEVRLSWHRVDD